MVPLLSRTLRINGTNINRCIDSIALLQKKKIINLFKVVNVLIGKFVFETKIESYLKENKNAIYLGRRIEEKIICSILPALQQH